MEVEQQNLFTMPTIGTDSPIKRREKAMKLSLEYAGEKFRDAFTQFVFRFLETNGPSDGETIRNAYERTSLPRPALGKWQGVGGIYAKLRREGKIVEVGKVRSKKFGNDLAVIALVK